jgi:hypothetical protein
VQGFRVLHFLSLEDAPFDEALCVSDDKLVFDLSDADIRLAS